MLTVQGDLFSSAIDQVFTFPLLVPLYQRTVVDDTEFSGGDLVGRYQKSDLALQVYYDWTDRREYHVAEKRRTFDVDLQYRLVWGGRKLYGVGGIGARPTRRQIQTCCSLIQVGARWSASLYLCKTMWR